jgi:hypothetical protein
MIGLVQRENHVLILGQQDTTDVSIRAIDESGASVQANKISLTIQQTNRGRNYDRGGDG